MAGASAGFANYGGALHKSHMHGPAYNGTAAMMRGSGWLALILASRVLFSQMAPLDKLVAESGA
jgi:hypothetical protein